ncbi:hypothetical protein C3492_36745 [Streptomyces sp. Ru62]|uniref:hypothetical protein n=1 Tax=Streptomyces sp. Ru62 TaxID=2080745 RepID=UPI000CDDAAF8|nr:hypothetical protein [Streptomyces sp. Ru62]POX58608.1 hypothetical protein C3492_36745 [Streptomyces sp. Ru62]
MITWTDADGTPRAAAVAYDEVCAGRRRDELQKVGATDIERVDVKPGELPARAQGPGGPAGGQKFRQPLRPIETAQCEGCQGPPTALRATPKIGMCAKLITERSR